MVMDRSKKIGSVPRRNADGASGSTGNALGPKHMGGAPAGRAQMRNQATSASGQYNARGKRWAGSNALLVQLGAIPDGALTEAVPFTLDLKPYVSNYSTAVGGWTLVDGPAGITLDDETGILSGTPTTASTGTATITVLAGSEKVSPDSITLSWAWEVAAA